LFVIGIFSNGPVTTARDETTEKSTSFWSHQIHSRIL